MHQNRFLQSLAIVALCMAAAIAYGMAHDQVTARVCVEYFTIGHPDIFGTDNPTLLGLGWGIVATWWVGLPLGILLAIAAQAGRRPPLTARQLVRPLATLLGIMACSALLAGIVGNLAASRHAVYLLETAGIAGSPGATCCFPHRCVGAYSQLRRRLPRRAGFMRSDLAASHRALTCCVSVAYASRRGNLRGCIACCCYASCCLRRAPCAGLQSAAERCTL